MPPLGDRLAQMLREFVDRLPQILVGLLMLALAYWAGRLAEKLIAWGIRKRGRAPGLGLAAGRLSHWSIVLAGLLAALAVALPTFRPVDVIELLGIWSVAVGFAFRDILQNFLAGILLLVTNPFREGDQIIGAGFEGTVTEIQARATLIRTYDGRRVVIPNATLFTQAVTVNTAFDTRRVEWELGIGYGDDVEAARRIIEDAARGVDGVRADPPPETLVAGLDASSIRIRVWFWCDSRRLELLHVLSRVIAAARDALRRAGVDLPFPTRQVLFHDQTEETDGDRRRQREGWPPGAEPPKPGSLAAAVRTLAEALRPPRA